MHAMQFPDDNFIDRLVAVFGLIVGLAILIGWLIWR